MYTEPLLMPVSLDKLFQVKITTQFSPETSIILNYIHTDYCPATIQVCTVTQVSSYVANERTCSHRQPLRKSKMGANKTLLCLW